MEQEGLFLFGFSDAGQAKFAAVAKVEPDLHHQDGTKALQGAGRSDGFGHHFKLRDKALWAGYPERSSAPADADRPQLRIRRQTIIPC